MTERTSEPIGRGSTGEFVRTLATAEDDAQAARMRASGFTYREIAKAQNCAVSAAHDRVQRALAAVPIEAVTDLRKVELDRMDTLVKQTLVILQSEHPFVSHGRIVPGVTDPRPKIAAVQTLLKISESRRRLLGLDEPIKHEVKVSDKITEEIERLAAELGVAPDGSALAPAQTENIG